MTIDCSLVVLNFGAYEYCSIPILQFHPPVPLAMSDLLMEVVRWRGEWRCVKVECGELFFTAVDGTSMMHKSHVDNWDTLQSVS